MSRDNPAEVRQIRQTLGFTQDQLAGALGFEGPHRRKTIERAETGAQPLSGPASRLLAYLAQGALDATIKHTIPEHVSAVGLEGEGPDLLLRLWRPRFVGVVTIERMPVADAMEGPIGEWLNVALWIDDPTAPPGYDVNALLGRALAAWISSPRTASTTSSGPKNCPSCVLERSPD